MSAVSRKGMRLLITGASGQLGGYLLRELAGKGLAVVAWSGSRRGDLFGFPLRPVDLADPKIVEREFSLASPTHVIHAGAVTRLADAHRDPEWADRVNHGGTTTLTNAASARGAGLFFISTDLVFDGCQGDYREDDPANPLSMYGRTKAAAEKAVLRYGLHTVVRVSLLFGPTVIGRQSFFDEQVAALRQGRRVSLFEDEWRTPLSYQTAARSLLALVAQDRPPVGAANGGGIIHLGGPERLSRVEMGGRLADHLGCNRSAIMPATRESASGPEPRPRDTSLDCSRWRKQFPKDPWPGYVEALREMGPAQDLAHPSGAS